MTRAKTSDLTMAEPKPKGIAEVLREMAKMRWAIAYEWDAELNAAAAALAEQAETIERLRAALELTTNHLDLSKDGWITDESETIAAAREALQGGDETSRCLQFDCLMPRLKESNFCEKHQRLSRGADEASDAR